MYSFSSARRCLRCGDAVEDLPCPLLGPAALGAFHMDSVTVPWGMIGTLGVSEPVDRLRIWVM